MKITIENFGPIKHFVFDTEKDLTLIFGKNNVGKSYAISLVYLILKNIAISKEAVQAFANIIKISEQINVDKNTFYIESFLNDYIKKLNDSIKSTFGSLKSISNQFSKEKLKISIHNYNAVFIIGLNEGSDSIIYNSIIHPANIFYFNKVYYLPASRSGLYPALNAFSQIIVKLSTKRDFIAQNFKIPAISEPLADYFFTLVNIQPENNEFSEYANEIEQEILQGKIEANHDTAKLYFTANNTNLRLDLSATSSMISEIAPLVSYLKNSIHTDKNKQVPILFIEEPEAHLHPEAQVKLMRVFARLVKDNKIKLVMTSHSNYIFNAASNLVMDNKIPIDKFEAVLFEMKEEGSVARPMATDEYGIDDDNFIDTAESLYEEKIDIINKING